MKILVTGGAGFIGFHVVRKLLNSQCEVCIVDNLSTGRRVNVPQDAELVEMDIRDSKLPHFMCERRFDGVIHLAAQTMVGVSVQDPLFDCQVNIAGLVNLLEGCRLSGTGRVVFASSAAVYGDITTVPVPEGAGGLPTSFYGLSKRAGERYLALYHELHGLDYVVLRYANVYGPRQGDGGEGGVVSIFCKNIAQDRPLQIFGDGTQTRDFVYAGDVAEANWQALTTAKCNTIYNIGTQREISLSALVGALEQAAGKKAVIEYLPVRAGDIYRSVLMHDKAVQVLQWQPQTLMDEGLKQTLAAVQIEAE